jgi:[ribosomal protein S5]-alanine N-acetyltransferase
MRTLEIGNLVLEPQTALHADEMFVVLCDPAIYEYENEPPASPDWLRTRFARLETRQSADGREQWLNWVVRLRGSALIGYVQATIGNDGHASIAYIFPSAYWGRGYASQAVDTMMAELALHHGVRRFFATFKRENQRSRRLLERLGFALAAPEWHVEHDVEPDEVLMWCDASPTKG